MTVPMNSRPNGLPDRQCALSSRIHTVCCDSLLMIAAPFGSITGKTLLTIRINVGL